MNYYQNQTWYETILCQILPGLIDQQQRFKIEDNQQCDIGVISRVLEMKSQNREWVFVGF